jgi:predicted P-loop ATPase
MRDTNTISDFINPDFKTAKYFPIEENIDDKSDEIKEAWKCIFNFANELNRNGRKFNNTDINHLTEQFCTVIHGLTTAKVEGVFIKVFEQNKDEFGIVDKPDIVKVELWLKKSWDFLQNEVTQMTEFKPKNADKWVEVNTDTIFRKLQHVGFKFGLDKLKSLLKSDFVPTYHPFIDYFEKLEPWDGVTDYIEELANYVNVTDNDFFKAQFKKALVRCIACSLYGKENRIVFTLVGEKQSTGKSTFLRFLNPFGNLYYTEAPLRNNKDSEFAFSENFTYNLEELSSLSNMDVNRLKSIISTASIKERKAYAVNATQQPRRCNFWGSTNKTEFLTDTENTRWLCFDLISIDWTYKENVDIKKVWAQALALYRDPNFSDQLTKEEAATRDAKNKHYEISDLEKELIKKTFSVCWANEGAFYSYADILSILQNGTATKLESRYINKNMKQLEFVEDVKKINGHPTRGFWAIYVPEGDRVYKDNENPLF